MILLLLLLFLKNAVSYSEDTKREWYELYIYATVQWHIVIMSMIYILSLVNVLNVVYVMVILLLVDTVLFVLSYRSYFLLRQTLNKNIFVRMGDKKYCGSPAEKFLYIIPLGMFLIALFFALVSVPYNYDSMTYHLPRVAHWAQNQSVFPYASNIDRQIGSTRIASYVCTLVYILSGKTDILLNLIQCMAYGTTALFVYAMSRKLGVTNRMSVLAAILFMATPIAFAEATTTQNDNYAAMWLVFFIYLILDMNDKQVKLDDSLHIKRKVFYLASCLALGYLTKPSVCFAMLIYLLWTLYCVIKRKDNIKLIFTLLCIGAITCIIFIAPSVIENIFVFEAFSPPNVGKMQLVGTNKPNYLLLNFLKTFTYNWGNLCIPNIKEVLAGFLYFMANIFGVNLNDASISEHGVEYGYGSYPYGCDTALQPLLMSLVMVSVIWCLLRRKKQKEFQKAFCFCVVISFCLLCVFMRWHCYITRYMIGYFALFCTLVVLQLEDMLSLMKNKFMKRGLIGVFVLILMLNYAIVVKNNWIIDTKEYPRTYFYHVGVIRSDYEKMCDVIRQRGFNKIGICCGTNSYEYPIWGMLQYDEKEYILKHVLVNDELSKYEDGNYVPDCILVIDRSMDKTFDYNGSTYNRIKIEMGTEASIYERRG